jgi:hypothetical protein
VQRAAGIFVSAVVGALIALIADATSRPSPAIRVLIPAAGVVGIYLLLTSETFVSRFPLLARIPGANRVESPTPDNGDTNVNYGSQGIGINRGTVNISAPHPSISVRQLAENKNVDEGYATLVDIHLDQPYAASNLAVLVNRPALKKFDVKLVGAGMLARSTIAFEGGQGIIIRAPLLSDYRATVVTEQPDVDLAIEARLNVEVQAQR